MALEMDAAETTAVSGLSCCLCAAADAETSKFLFKKAGAFAPAFPLYDATAITLYFLRIPAGLPRVLPLAELFLLLSRL